MYHSPTTSGARVERLSPDRFLTDVVRPYYLALGLPRPPESLDGFAADESVEKFDPQRVPDGASLRDDLLKMRRSLPRYRDELAGDVVDVELGELRRYVAYPTREVPADRRRPAEAIAQLAAGRAGFAGYLNSLSTTEAVAEPAAALSGSGELCLVLADLPPWEVEEAKNPWRPGRIRGPGRRGED